MDHCERQYQRGEGRDQGVSINDLEAHYLAGGNVERGLEPHREGHPVSAILDEAANVHAHLNPALSDQAKSLRAMSVMASTAGCFTRRSAEIT